MTIRHHLPDPQPWAVSQERARHEDALYRFGEYTMFVLLWDMNDFVADLVGRCSTCYLSREVIADAYAQQGQTKCPNCLGTTFEGGWKAKIVRPSLWDSALPGEHQTSRGVVETASASIQTTSDFKLSIGDYLFRGDGTRWQCQSLSTNRLRSGFGLESSDYSLGYNYGQVVLEEATSVAYITSPTENELKQWLDVRYVRALVDFTTIETIRGPLL
jgi:hypothetical protein